MRGSAEPSSSRRRDKTKSPLAFSQRALGSGDVLLSHGLSPYYHRGCSVSLPCSEWERVGPPRYCHQRSEPDWHLNRTGGFAAFAATQARRGSLETGSICQRTADSLISTYRVWEHAL